jgi:hypothetical protein
MPVPIEMAGQWSAIRKLALSSVVPLNSRKRMDELAAERNAQQLSIRYGSGPRDQKILSFQQVLRTPQPSELIIVQRTSRFN